MKNTGYASRIRHSSLLMSAADRQCRASPFGGPGVSIQRRGPRTPILPDPIGPSASGLRDQRPFHPNIPRPMLVVS